MSKNKFETSTQKSKKRTRSVVNALAESWLLLLTHILARLCSTRASALFGELVMCRFDSDPIAGGCVLFLLC